MEKRAPIIAIMGHVDHGKTTLLDYIRKTNIAEKEAGGITQSIGAYEIVHDGNKITFIDTPGHEAFSKMREHSARIADLAILVVAADDGVKPQTLNALEYIKKENITCIVAINKTDKPNANVEKTKTDLANAGVYLEGFGGDVSWHAISAKTGDGANELLDLVVLASEMQDLSYDPKASPTGVVITSKLDARRGGIVGVIVKNGTLSQGLPIGTKTAKGKVKILNDFLGKTVKSLVPSAPALIMGFETLPQVGEEFACGDECEKIHKGCLTTQSAPGKSSRDQNIITLIIKADEAGSLEAARGIATRIPSEKPIVIASASVGDIYETDIKFAQSTNAIILGFRIKIDKAALNMARNEKVIIFESDIIYELEKDLIEYVKRSNPKEMPRIEIKGVFGSKGKERIIGGGVALGPVKNQGMFDIWRNEKILGSGKVLNLQSGRKDVLFADAGVEVGLLVESDIEIRVGDKIIFV
jgi:translation initiation factor IF-2